MPGAGSERQTPSVDENDDRAERTDDVPSRRPWWQRTDGVPRAELGEPRGSVDAWALRQPAVAAAVGALVLVVVGLVLGGGLVAVVVGVVWGVLQYALLELRRRRSNPPE